MKKLILIIAVIFLCGCCSSPNEPVTFPVEVIENPVPGHSVKTSGTVVIDSCEYIQFLDFREAITHKGNCRFCAERQRKMIEQIISQKTNLN